MRNTPNTSPQNLWVNGTGNTVEESGDESRKLNTGHGKKVEDLRVGIPVKISKKLCAQVKP